MLIPPADAPPPHPPPPLALGIPPKSSATRLLHQLERGLAPAFQQLPPSSAPATPVPASTPACVAHPATPPAPASTVLSGPPTGPESFSADSRFTAALLTSSTSARAETPSPAPSATPAMTPDLSSSASELSSLDHTARAVPRSSSRAGERGLASSPAPSDASRGSVPPHQTPSRDLLRPSHPSPSPYASQSMPGYLPSEQRRPSTPVRSRPLSPSASMAPSSSLPAFALSAPPRPALVPSSSAQSYRVGSPAEPSAFMVPMLTTSSPKTTQLPSLEMTRSPSLAPPPLKTRPALSSGMSDPTMRLSDTIPSPGSDASVRDLVQRHAASTGHAPWSSRSPGTSGGHEHSPTGDCCHSRQTGLALTQAASTSNGFSSSHTVPPSGSVGTGDQAGSGSSRTPTGSNNGSGNNGAGNGSGSSGDQRGDRDDRDRRDPSRSKGRDKSHGRVTHCAGCGKRMSGQFVRALGTVYHYNCFCCRDCGANVAAKFFPNDPDNKTGEKYALCERDYFRRLSLICAKCGNALRGSYITALNKKFHIEHFTCSLCEVVFGPRDAYYEHDKKVYCHFHYSTRFAVACEGCKTAILRQFVEFVRNGHTETWHPECYMINKFWNVKLSSSGEDSDDLEIEGEALDTTALAITSSDDEPRDGTESGMNPVALQRALKLEATETPESLKAKQKAMEERVLRVWTVLSGFEESSASCISNMQRLVTAGNYLGGINMADKIVFHVEVLFAAIDKLEERSRELNPPFDEDPAAFQPVDGAPRALPAPGDDSQAPRKPAGLIPLREARMLCKRIVNFFSILSRPPPAPADGAPSSPNPSGGAVPPLARDPSTLVQELVPLITGMAQYLKMLIRLALMGAVHLNDHAVFDKFLDQLACLEEMGRGVGVPPKESEGQDIGCGYLTIPRDAPWRPSDGTSKSRQGAASTDLCAFCHQTVEEECFALNNKTRWHLSCFRCERCTRPTTGWVPKKDRSDRAAPPTASPNPAQPTTAQAADARIAAFTKSIDNAPEAWPVEQFGVETRRWTSKSATPSDQTPRPPGDTILPPVPTGQGTSSPSKPSHGTSYAPLCGECEQATGTSTAHGVVRITRLEQYTFLLRVALTRLFYQLKRRGLIYLNPPQSLTSAPGAAAGLTSGGVGAGKPSGGELLVPGTGALTRSSTAASANSFASMEGHVRRRTARSNLSLDRKVDSKAKVPHISTVVRGPTGKTTGVATGTPQALPSPQPPTIETPTGSGNDYFSQPMAPGPSRSPILPGGRDKLYPPSGVGSGRRSVSPGSASGMGASERSLSADRNDKLLPRTPTDDSRPVRPSWGRSNTDVQIQEGPMGDRLSLEPPETPMNLDDVTNQLDVVPEKDANMPFIASLSSEQRLVLKCMALACLTTDAGVSRSQRNKPTKSLSADTADSKLDWQGGDKSGLDEPGPSGVATPELRTLINPDEFLAAEDFLLDPSEPRKGNIWSKLFPQTRKANHKRGGGAIFGVPLQTLITNHGIEIISTATQANIKVPTLLDEVMVAMRYLDPSVEGIFRKNGNIRKLKEVADLVDRGGTFKSSMLNDNVIQLAAFLKRFLRELPDPLLTFRLYPLYMASQEMENEQERLRALRYVSLLLPTAHRDTMEEFFAFVKWVANFEKIDGESGSRMDLVNLATVLGPNLLYAKPSTSAPDDRSTALPANEVVLNMMQHQDLFWVVPREFKAPLEDPDLLALAGSGDPGSTRELLRKCTDKYLGPVGPSSMAGMPSSSTLALPAPGAGLSRSVSNAGRSRGKTIAEGGYPGRPLGHQSSSSLVPNPPHPKGSYPPLGQPGHQGAYASPSSSAFSGSGSQVPQSSGPQSLAPPGHAEPMAVSLSHSAVPASSAGASLAASILTMHQAGLSSPNLRQMHTNTSASGSGADPSGNGSSDRGGYMYPPMPAVPSRQGSAGSGLMSHHGEVYRVRSSSPAGTRTQSPRPSSLSSHGHSGQSNVSPTPTGGGGGFGVGPGVGPGVGAGIGAGPAPGMVLVPGSLVPGALVSSHTTSSSPVAHGHAGPPPPPPQGAYGYASTSPYGLQGNFAGVGVGGGNAAASPRLGTHYAGTPSSSPSGPAGAHAAYRGGGT